jgi:fatty-acyl-CoA synthase
MSHTLSSAVSWWARNQPDVAAFTIGDDVLTYRVYDAWSARAAEALLDRGIAPGDRVCVCAETSPEYCVLAMAVIRARAILVPMSLRLTRYEAADILEDIKPALMFHGQDNRDRYEGLGVALSPISAVAEFRHGGAAMNLPALDEDAAVVIISTSGSTAKPKGVMLSHRSMVNYVSEFALHEPAIGRAARVAVAAPLSTSAGYVQMIHYTTLGCSVYLEPAFDAARALHLITTQRINAFSGVPVLFERIAALPEFATADVSSLRLVTVGGARVTTRLLDAWMTKGVVLRQMYGQTECGGNGTIMPEHLARVQPEKCGWGGIFTDIEIRTPEGGRAACGEIGEIVIRGPGRMAGYWNNPGATAEVLRDGWLHTGDLGVLNEDGLLTFVDRMKDIIISGGLNISAAEVERVVGQYSGVEEVVVIAAPDPKFAETPMAVVHAIGPIDIGALIAHCNERLADYKVPRYVVVEDAPLPRLNSGKLSKPAVRAKYKDLVAGLTRVR